MIIRLFSMFSLSKLFRMVHQFQLLPFTVARQGLQPVLVLQVSQCTKNHHTNLTNLPILTTSLLTAANLTFPQPIMLLNLVMKPFPPIHNPLFPQDLMLPVQSMALPNHHTILHHQDLALLSHPMTPPSQHMMLLSHLMMPPSQHMTLLSHLMMLPRHLMMLPNQHTALL